MLRSASSDVASVAESRTKNVKSIKAKFRVQRSVGSCAILPWSINNSVSVQIKPLTPSSEVLFKGTPKMSSILLKGGTVLIHDSDDNVDPIKADVLIQDTRITKIEPNISLPPALEGCKVIDCTDRIISPGFVDTHRHLWQTPLKGQFADEAFMPYMAVSTSHPNLSSMFILDP